MARFGLFGFLLLWNSFDLIRRRVTTRHGLAVFRSLGAKGELRRSARLLAKVQLSNDALAHLGKGEFALGRSAHTPVRGCMTISFAILPALLVAQLHLGENDALDDALGIIAAVELLGAEGFESSRATSL